ncbi:hypothetical protein FOL47_002990, partial [Perkinsus chesapeaki]
MRKLTDYFVPKRRASSSSCASATASNTCEDLSQAIVDHNPVASPLPSPRAEEPLLKKKKVGPFVKYRSSFEQFAWLHMVEGNQKLSPGRNKSNKSSYLCRICMAMGLRGKWGDVVVETTGNKLSDKCKKHASSQVHIANERAYTQAQRVSEGLAKPVSEQVWSVASKQVKENRLHIQEIARLAYCCFKMELAHTTQFPRLVKHVAGETPGAKLTDYLASAPGNATYTSKFTVVELLSTTAKVIRERTAKELDNVGGLCLIADEATVRGVTGSFLTVMVRSVDTSRGEPKEHLIDLRRVKKTDGESLFEEIEDALNTANISLDRIHALSFDGGANFAGHKAHTLALCMKAAAGVLCPK